jgi:hypothetical protein
VVFADAAESCHRAGGYGSSGVDFERFRKLEGLGTESDVNGVFASDNIVQSQARGSLK